MITCMLNSGLNIDCHMFVLVASYEHGYENYVIILEWIEVMGFVANSSPRITYLGSLKPAELENSPPAGHSTTKRVTAPLNLVVPYGI